MFRPLSHRLFTNTLVLFWSFVCLIQLETAKTDFNHKSEVWTHTVCVQNRCLNHWATGAPLFCRIQLKTSGTIQLFHLNWDLISDLLHQDVMFRPPSHWCFTNATLCAKTSWQEWSLNMWIFHVKNWDSDHWATGFSSASSQSFTNSNSHNTLHTED